MKDMRLRPRRDSEVVNDIPFVEKALELFYRYCTRFHIARQELKASVSFAPERVTPLNHANLFCVKKKTMCDGE
jgi:hypothetical protein